MGCRAITPDLVGLARRLEGMPFHLVATHRQRNPKEEVVAYLKGQGLPADTPNFTLSSFGGHPKVKGNGYVPYYMVFDHRGKLVRHHMAGQYHGGDGLKMIEVVDRLLEDAPALYLGEEPFVRIPDLAAEVGAKKKLGAAVKKIEKRLAAEEPDPAADELERLLGIVRSYRDRKLERAAGLVGGKPSRVLPMLTELSKELKGSDLGDAVDERLSEMKSSKELRRALGVEKSFRKVVEGLERLPPCKSCKRKGMKAASLTCPDCRAVNEGSIRRAKEKLGKLAEKNSDLPIAAEVRRFADSL